MRFVFIGLFAFVALPGSGAALPLVAEVDQPAYGESIAELRRWMGAETESLRDRFQQITEIYASARSIAAAAHRATSARPNGSDSSGTGVFQAEPIRLMPTKPRKGLGTNQRGHDTADSYDGNTSIFEAVVQLPQHWIKERRRLVAKWTVFDQHTLPLRNPSANLQRAIYRFHSSAVEANARRIAFRHALSGLGLSRGLYYISAEIGTVGTNSARQHQHSVVSLGAFFVKRNPEGVRLPLPHYRNWYVEDEKVLDLKQGRATATSKEIQITAQATVDSRLPRSSPIYQEITVSSESRRPRVLLRRRTVVNAISPSLRFAIPRQRLTPGTHRLRLSLYVETKSKRGVRVDHDLALYLPAGAKHQAPSNKIAIRPRSPNTSQPKGMSKGLKKDLQVLFRNHAARYGYRYRLYRLKRAWTALGERFKKKGDVPQPTRYAPPPKQGWRIDDALASDAPTLEQATRKIRCLNRRQCRLWLRIASSSEDRKTARSCKLNIRLKSTTGRTLRLAEHKFRLEQPVTVLDIPLRKKSIYRDSYSGAVKIRCGTGTKSKTFPLHMTSND
jgi:hypothetical protein